MNLIELESWVLLIIAIIFGVLGTVAMKLSYGLQKLRPSLYMALFYAISFIALTFAMDHIHLSVVYAMWSGIGTVLVAAIGIIYFHESLSLRKIIYLTLVVIGIIGIHFSDSIT